MAWCGMRWPCMVRYGMVPYSMLEGRRTRPSLSRGGARVWCQGVRYGGGIRVWYQGVASGCAIRGWCQGVVPGCGIRKWPNRTYVAICCFSLVRLRRTIIETKFSRIQASAKPKGEWAPEPHTNMKTNNGASLRALWATLQLPRPTCAAQQRPHTMSQHNDRSHATRPPFKQKQHLTPQQGTRNRGTSRRCPQREPQKVSAATVSYTHLRAHET